LAEVGDQKLTLGDYAAALERMDRFERLRFQTPERRKKLVEELVNVELLAAEAKRRKLDQDPAVQERLRQVLRDEVLRRARERSPGPESIPEREVRAYYDAHKEEFRTPERRRVSVISVRDAAAAATVLDQARGATPAAWGALVKSSSGVTSPEALGPEAPELAGDLGFVSAPGEVRGMNRRVPEPVRAALFRLTQVGDVWGEVVPAEGAFYILRMTSRAEPAQRSFAEAERTIRVTLAEQRLTETEAKLERELRQRYPVRIDEAALATLESALAKSAPAPQTAPAHGR
jgi:hypothetical protein